MRSQKLSIVIPSYLFKIQDLKATFWPSWIVLMQQCKDVEWLVVESYHPPNKPELIPWLEKQNIPCLRLLPLPLNKPSRAKAFNYAISKAHGQKVALLYEDCCISIEGLQQLQNLALQTWGGFYKEYDSPSPLLQFSAAVQNHFRFPRGKLVGTNGLMFPRSFWQKHLFEGCFLEDVIFSDQACKELGKPQCLGKIIISSRRYQARGVIRCLVENCIILIGFRLGFSSANLKRLYPSVKED